MKYSFATLDPQQALYVAIFIEKRNAEFYHHLAEMFVEFGDSESLEIASVFWDMAIEERRHAALLQTQYWERYRDLQCALTEEDLSDLIEVPKLEDGDVFAAHGISDNLAARERALHVALHAELNAQRYYANLMEHTPEGALRHIYRELAHMEDGHVAYLERKLTQESIEDSTVN